MNNNKQSIKNKILELKINREKNIFLKNLKTSINEAEAAKLVKNINLIRKNIKHNNIDKDNLINKSNNLMQKIEILNIC